MKSVNENNEAVLTNIKLWNLGLWKKTAIFYQPQRVIYFCIWFKLRKMEKILIHISKTDTICSFIAHAAISE